MRGSRLGWFAGAVLAVALLQGCAKAQAAEMGQPTTASHIAPSVITAADLVMPGAKVEFQMDLNGESAVLLLGGAIDALIDSAKEQTEVMKEHSDQLPPQAAMVLKHVGPLAGPTLDAAKDALKGITRVTVLVMRPGAQTTGDGITNRYSALMIRHGWQPLLSIKADGDATVLAYIAPEGKGVFGVAQERPGSEVAVMMVSASKPLGDLIGQVIRTASPLASHFILLRAEDGAPQPTVEHESVGDTDPPAVDEAEED